MPIDLEFMRMSRPRICIVTTAPYSVRLGALLTVGEHVFRVVQVPEDPSWCWVTAERVPWWERAWLRAAAIGKRLAKGEWP